MLEEMESQSQEKDWITANKDKIKILFGLLLLHGIVPKPTMVHFFIRNRLLITRIFYGTMPEK